MECLRFILVFPLVFLVFHWIFAREGFSQTPSKYLFKSAKVVPLSIFFVSTPVQGLIYRGCTNSGSLQGICERILEKFLHSFIKDFAEGLGNYSLSSFRRLKSGQNQPKTASRGFKSSRKLPKTASRAPKIPVRGPRLF